MPSFFQFLGTDDSHIHQGHRFFLFALVQFLTDSQILFIGLANSRVVDLNFVDNCAESSMTAMVRPVGINQTDFGDGGVTVFDVFEVTLAESNVVKIHCQAVRYNKSGKFLIRQLDKSISVLTVVGIS